MGGGEATVFDESLDMDRIKTWGRRVGAWGRALPCAVHLFRPIYANEEKTVKMLLQMAKLHRMEHFLNGFVFTINVVKNPLKTFGKMDATKIKSHLSAIECRIH